MKIADFRRRIREDFIDLEISSADYVFRDNHIQRAIEAAIEDISRFVPNEKYAELVVSSSELTQTFSSTGITTLSEIQITNYPVRRPLSITNGGTTYTEETDYNVDYINGIITFPTGSAIIALADGVTLTITYQKSRMIFPLSLKDLVSIKSVRVLSSNQEYGDTDDFNLVGNLLQWNKSGLAEIPDGYRLSLAYYARHSTPTDDNDGSLPDYYSEIVIKGAEAHLLLGFALNLELGQRDNYNDLSSLDSDYTVFATYLGQAADSIELAIDQIANLITYFSSQQGNIEQDFLDIDTRLGQVDALVTLALTPTSNAITFIDTEVVSTDIASSITDHNSISTALTNAIAELTAAKGFIDTEVGTDLTDAKTALTTVLQGYLDLGDDFINEINVGESVALTYAKYAEMAATKGENIANLVSGRLKLAETYVTIGDEYYKHTQALYNMAQISIENAKLRLGVSDEYFKQSSAYIEMAKLRMQQVETFLNQIKARIEIVNLYLQLGQRYLEVSAGYQKNAEIKLQGIQSSIQRASEVRQQGIFILELAQRIRVEGTRRYQDFQATIQDKTQMVGTLSSVSPKQPR